MTEPKRLLADPSASAMQRMLLASFDENPSPEAKKKTLAALGFAVAGGIAASGAGTSIAPIAPAAPSASKAAGISLTVKLTLLSILVVGGVGSAIAIVKPSAPVASSPPLTRAAQVTQISAPSTLESAGNQAPFASNPSSGVATDSRGSSNSARSHAARGVATSANAVPAAPASPAAGTLGAELATMDRARAALESGDAASAINGIDEYESRYKNGVFMQEAEALRVQALLAENDRAGAERVGKRFLARYPDSPHADRVRRLLGSSK